MDESKTDPCWFNIVNLFYFDFFEDLNYDVEISLFSWAVNEPNFDGSNTCGWGRDQCVIGMRVSATGLDDYYSSYSGSHYCSCECMLKLLKINKF